MGVWRWVFLAGLALYFASCSLEQDFSLRGHARLNLSVDPPSLDPSQAVDLTSGIVMKMLFEGLTRIQPDGQPAPALAERIEVLNEGKLYRFHMKKSRWSNGTPVTAEDFAYAWRLSLDPAYPSPYAYQLYVIHNAREAKLGEKRLDEVGIRVVDPYTLEVELTHPIPYFLHLTAFHSYYPIPNQLAKSNPRWAEAGATPLVSNGPFRLARWRHHRDLHLVKNRRYWDAAAVALRGIHLSVIEDANTELRLFEEGELHFAGRPLSVGLPGDALPSLKESGKLRIKPMLGCYFYKFNTTVFPLNQVKFRRALCLATRRQNIVDYITQAGETPALGLVPVAISPRPEGYFRDGDLPEAQRLLAEVLKENGLTLEQLPTLQLSYNTHESHHQIAQAIQQQWFKGLGIQVSLENYEWKVYLDQLHKLNYQVGRLAWIADFPDAINFLEIFKYRDGGNNDTGWENPQYTAWLDQALAESDENKRREWLGKAEALLMEEVPLIPIYHMTTTYLQSPELKGVFISSLGDVDFKWSYLNSQKPL